jgi:hypothetical protein
MAAFLILSGQLLGAAFACGLNLYLTVAVLGVTARLDLLAELPPGMRGLENGVVIGVAGALWLVGLIADRIPAVDHLWEAAHTIIRPAAAGLLVGLALMGAPPHIQAAGVAGAILVALTAHGTKAGLRMMLTLSSVDEAGRIRPRRGVARTATGLLEDTAAVGVAVAALLYPSVAVVVFAAALLLLIILGPRLWRAAMLGLRAVIARIRGFFGRPGWRYRAQLPRSVRDAVPLEPLGLSPARALPAAVRGLRSAGDFRHGWLVFTCDGPRFVYTSRFRARSAELAGIHAVALRPGVLTDSLEVRGHQQQPLTFILLKDGPPADLAAAELAATAGPAAADLAAGAPPATDLAANAS